jgi:hypothetical protein
MKRMIAVAMLAVFATLGAQTAMATDGVLISDRSGVLISDNAKDGVLLSDKVETKYDVSTYDIVSVVLRMVDGVLLSD